ncbi:MAG: YtxH domain-containing protein [Candidatus Aminicenantes bacterium]|nr:YtxH domain-containing protein [Candidatus Aminicenantes bacterium]
MVENNKTYLGAMIYSFLGGMMLGAGLALLFAPVSGSEARSAIANEFDEIKEKLIQLEEKLHKPDAGSISETPDKDFM